MTAEHSVYFDQKLIPARTLVNHSSVYYQKNLGSHRVFHIETECHSILFANDLPTESYLDTGNRGSFHGQAGMTSAKLQVWEQDAAAPLATDQSEIKPLWIRLAARAIELYPNCGVTLSECNKITKPPHETIEIRLSDNREINAQWEGENTAVFTLPHPVEGVTICSDTFRPCDLVGPYFDDRRTHGVFVRDITLNDS